MKISDVALAIYVNKLNRGQAAAGTPTHAAKAAFEEAEAFMDVLDDYLTSKGLIDEDARPK